MAEGDDLAPATEDAAKLKRRRAHRGRVQRWQVPRPELPSHAYLVRPAASAPPDTSPSAASL